MSSSTTTTSIVEIRHNRPRASTNDWANSFAVYIDDRMVGRLSPAGVLSTEVQPGTHRLRIAMLWWRSPELVIEVAQGQTISYVADLGSDGPFANMLRRALHPRTSLLLEATPPNYIEPARRDPPRIASKPWRYALIGSSFIFPILIIGLLNTTQIPPIILIAALLAWGIAIIPISMSKQRPPRNGRLYGEDGGRDVGG
jgi:hypothetical protein